MLHRYPLLPCPPAACNYCYRTPCCPAPPCSLLKSIFQVPASVISLIDAEELDCSLHVGEFPDRLPRRGAMCDTVFLNPTPKASHGAFYLSSFKIWAFGWAMAAPFGCWQRQAVSAMAAASVWGAMQRRHSCSISSRALSA